VATKTDLQTVGNDVQEIKQLYHRLDRKVDKYHASNVGHHLETRDMIGDFNRQLLGLCDGLSRAGDSLQQIS